jgi:hypothetical protein
MVRDIPYFLRTDSFGRSLLQSKFQISLSAPETSFFEDHSTRGLVNPIAYSLVGVSSMAEWSFSHPSPEPPSRTQIGKKKYKGF